MIDDKAIVLKAIVRIAELSLSMGLDECDERLLWDYAASCITKGTAMPTLVLKVLGEQAQLDPYFIERVCVYAVMDNKFVIKPKKRFFRNKARAKDLVKESAIEVSDLAYDLDRYRQRSSARAREAIFSEWYGQIEPVIRDDGVNWEPPCASDICMDVSFEYFRLRDKLNI